MASAISRLTAQLRSPKGIASGILGVGAMQAVMTGSTMLATVILARALGPEELGLFAFASSIVVLIALPVNAGLPNLVMREVARYEHGERWDLMKGILRRAHQFVGLAVLCIVLPVAGYAWYRSGGEANGFWAVLFAAIWLIPFNALSNLRAATMKGWRFAVMGNAPEMLVRRGGFFLLVLALYLAGMSSAVEAAIAQSLACACAFVVGAYLLSRVKPAELKQAQPSFDTARWAKDWLPFTFLAGVTVADLQLGTALIGSLAPEAEVGYFRVASTVASAVAIPLLVVNMVIAPHFARRHAQGDMAGLGQLARTAARIVAALAFPAALVLWLFGEPLVELVFGADFRPAVLPMLVLVSAQMINVLAGSVGQLLNMTGNQRVTAQAIGSGLVLNVLGCLWLVPQYGALGGALATAASILFWNLFMVWRLWRILGLRTTAI